MKTSFNTALDERQVKEDAEKLKEYYQKVGFNQVSVSYTITRDRSTGLGTVIFRIREGRKVKIKEIRFVGNAHLKAKTLRGLMDTKKYGFFSWITGSGRSQAMTSSSGGRYRRAARRLPRARLP